MGRCAVSTNNFVETHRALGIIKVLEAIALLEFYKKDLLCDDLELKMFKLNYLTELKVIIKEIGGVQ
jgi:hypothetical protein